MDDFLSVLRKGASGTGKGPALLAAGFMYGLVGVFGLFQYTEYGQTILSDTADMMPSLLFVVLTMVLPLVVSPYLFGGALGYAIELASGKKPGWPTFSASARKHYLNLFFGGIIAFLIYTIMAFVLILLMGSGVLCFLALPAAIIVFVCLAAIEFYDIAIVAEGLDFIKGFTASVAFVRKHFGPALLFFAIALVARFLVQLPIMSMIEFKLVAEFLANNSDIFNNTTSATNMTALNMTDIASQAITFSVPSLLGIAVLQILLQSIVFAFLVAYKAEFYRWAKSIKNITDFDYEFPDEKKS